MYKWKIYTALDPWSLLKSLDVTNKEKKTWQKDLGFGVEYKAEKLCQGWPGFLPTVEL